MVKREISKWTSLTPDHMCLGVFVPVEASGTVNTYTIVSSRRRAKTCVEKVIC